MGFADADKAVKPAFVETTSARIAKVRLMSSP
jgi:hypothetical protein